MLKKLNPFKRYCILKFANVLEIVLNKNLNGRKFKLCIFVSFELVISFFDNFFHISICLNKFYQTHAVILQQSEKHILPLAYDIIFPPQLL